MRARVRGVVSDATIELDQPWVFHGMKGNRVRIAGLLPSEKADIDQNKRKLAELVGGQLVSVDDFLFVSGKTLNALVSYSQKPLQEYFSERMIPAPEPSRWVEAEEKLPIGRVYGGVPTAWRNPIASLPPERAPFLGNLKYPVKPWERDYDEQKALVEALFSDSHHNKLELDRWFEAFLRSPQREAPLLVVGDVGIGKSWWLSHKLMHLNPKEYHPIVVDLRYTLRGSELASSIAWEIDDFLRNYVTDLSWLYADFQAAYGERFDPQDPAIRGEMAIKALSIVNVYELNAKRLRFYARSGAPKAIIAFDNIDHFDEEEQSTVLDMCRRLAGHSSGVKTLVAIRPTTMLPKSRSGVFFGDSILRPVTLKSPDIYEVLRRRLSTNDLGEKLNMATTLASSGMTWAQLLERYRKSDCTWGFANLVKELCCSEVLLPDASGKFSPSRSSPTGAAYDTRHYLRLFRRILRSDALEGLQNIDSMYYGIHALLLSGSEPLSESDAYLFNLFDNERPTMRGNALIRYRVLEYCALFSDLGQIFDVYFRALGCGAEEARRLITKFDEAGLVVTRSREGPSGIKIPIRAQLTIAGQRHLEVISNLWYVICVKTGINIFKEYIVYGEDAKLKASEFVTSERILDYYAEHGWVSEESFVDFLGEQELLESKRIGAYQESHPEWREQVATMAEMMSSPAAIIYWSYKQQKASWRRAQESRAR